MDLVAGMKTLKRGTLVRSTFEDDGRIGKIVCPAHTPSPSDPTIYVYRVRFESGIRSVHVGWLEMQS